MLAKALFLPDDPNDGFCLHICDGVLFFGRDKVNFLHNILYGAIFWICDENSIDNTPVF